MAANAPGLSLNIHEVCCINVHGRSEFPIKEELSKLPIAVPIDDKSRICKLCLKKLRKQKSLHFKCINTWKITEVSNSTKRHADNSGNHADI